MLLQEEPKVFMVTYDNCFHDESIQCRPSQALRIRVVSSATVS